MDVIGEIKKYLILCILDDEVDYDLRTSPHTTSFTRSLFPEDDSSGLNEKYTEVEEKVGEFKSTIKGERDRVRNNIVSYYEEKAREFTEEQVECKVIRIGGGHEGKYGIRIGISCQENEGLEEKLIKELGITDVFGKY